MTPIVPSTTGKLTLIRPMVYIKEDSIIDYTKKWDTGDELWVYY